MKHPLNIFFDKVFVISIKRNQHRLQSFIQLNPDIEIEIFPGIDGKLLYPAIEHVSNFPTSFFTENELSYDRCRVWNKGQLGCAMSNLLLQKEILNRNIQKVLILEDDAFLIKRQLVTFNKAIKSLPLDWELFYLGFTPLSKWSESRITRSFMRLKYFFRPSFIDGLSSADLKKHFFSSTFSRYLNIPGVYMGTHAYALTYEGAKNLVAIDSPLQHGFDTTLMFANYHRLIKSYSLKKPLFMPNLNFETSLIN